MKITNLDIIEITDITYIYVCMHGYLYLYHIAKKFFEMTYFNPRR